MFSEALRTPALSHLVQAPVGGNPHEFCRLSDSFCGATSTNPLTRVIRGTFGVILTSFWSVCVQQWKTQTQ